MALLETRSSRFCADTAHAGKLVTAHTTDRPVASRASHDGATNATQRRSLHAGVAGPSGNERPRNGGAACQLQIEPALVVVEPLDDAGVALCGGVERLRPYLHLVLL